MEQKQLNVLIACEESQAVCKEFRALGHRAFSCDIQECSGGHPEWHVCGDVLPLLNGNCTFQTSDTHTHTQAGEWDLIIAHPPCTFLTVSGNRWFNTDRYGKKAEQRWNDRVYGAVFFMQFVAAQCKHIAIENPVGVMGSAYRKADQIIQPFEYGHPYTKQTCLWLKNLPHLEPTNILERPEAGWVNQCFTPDGRYGGFKSFNGSKQRSKTFPGIAKAMAEQWSDYILNGSDQMSLFEEVSK